MTDKNWIHIFRGPQIKEVRIKQKQQEIILNIQSTVNFVIHHEANSLIEVVFHEWPDAELDSMFFQLLQLNDLETDSELIIDCQKSTMNFSKLKKFELDLTVNNTENMAAISFKAEHFNIQVNQ